jgi:hypothetical protein
MLARQASENNTTVFWVQPKALCDSILRGEDCGERKRSRRMGESGGTGKSEKAVKSRNVKERREVQER